MKPFRPSFAAALAAGCLALCALPASVQAQQMQAQQIRRFFPAGVEHGVIAFGEPPHITLDGKPMLLAAGTRIRNEKNRVMLSGALTGQTHMVNYALGPSGELREIWILTAEEIHDIQANGQSGLIRPRPFDDRESNLYRGN